MAKLWDFDTNVYSYFFSYPSVPEKVDAGRALASLKQSKVSKKLKILKF
jgi:hypothetical protein